jgi:hypothetical protein
VPLSIFNLIFEEKTFLKGGFFIRINCVANVFEDDLVLAEAYDWFLVCSSLCCIVDLMTQ